MYLYHYFYQGTKRKVIFINFVLNVGTVGPLWLFYLTRTEVYKILWTKCIVLCPAVCTNECSFYLWHRADSIKLYSTPPFTLHPLSPVVGAPFFVFSLFDHNILCIQNVLWATLSAILNLINSNLIGNRTSKINIC